MAASNEFEYIVVGLGGIGSAAAYWLARRAGKDVLALDQFELGHDKGASEDHSRIIRLSYHTPHYVALARHAYEAWRDLEEDSGESLLVITGDLMLNPRDSAMPLTDYIASMAAEKVPFEVLDAAEIMYRWPQFRLDDGVHGTFQPQGGIAPARKGVLEHARMAVAHGATLVENAPVTSVKLVGGGLEVTTIEGTYRCRRLVLATDAWTNRLLAPLGLTLPLTMTQEQVNYFASGHLDDFRPGRFPVWIWLDDPNFYGIPVYGEEHGVNVAQDMGGREVTVETRTFEADPVISERVSRFVRQVLPGADGPILYSKTCLYTLTPDRDFVIDTLPDYPQIALALGAGHGYKFAGLIGRILADLAIDETTQYDIEPFSLSRPILHMENPPKSFLLTRGGQISASIGAPASE